MSLLSNYFSRPDSWRQGEPATNAEGECCDWGPEAHQMCLWGAINGLYGERSEANYAVEEKLDNILKERGHRCGVINWNETKGRTQQEVLDLCLEAGV